MSETRANWTLANEQGPNRFYISDGGGVKITRENENGDERMVYMGSLKMFLQLGHVVDFIQACQPKATTYLSDKKARDDREKIALKAQMQAAKAIENLKAAGLNEEAIRQALLDATKKSA